MNVNEDNYRDLMPEDIQGAVDSVKHGFDPVAADNLICYFHYMLRDGHLFDRVQLKPVERAFVEYVAHAFARKTEKGKPTEAAFGLKQGRGEYQRADTTDRDFASVVLVILLMRNGLTWADAKGEAANRFFPDGTGDKAVEAAYSEHKKNHWSFLWELPDQTLTKMLPEGTPVIKRDMAG